MSRVIFLKGYTASEAHPCTFYSHIRLHARKWYVHDSNSDSNTPAWDKVILGKEEKEEDSITIFIVI